MTPSIVDLANLVEQLPAECRQAFDRIFAVETAKSRIKLPEAMLTWVEHQFGSVDKVTTQTIVKITNLITREMSVYNPLRALRPLDFTGCQSVSMALEGTGEVDQFASPLDNTPEDLFDRIEGRHCITASNIAKYEQYHCVIIFNNQEPMNFGPSEVADYIETGWRWAQRAHDFDPLALYGMFLWNCTNKAGASIRHGHAQVVMARGSHYPGVEYLRRAALEYRQRYERKYFDDLCRVHEALGLGWRSGGTRTLAYLTALKKNETIVMSDGMGTGLTGAIGRVLAAFRDRLGVTSFNVGLVFPALGDRTGWEEFPVIARMVDRGDVYDISSDIGAMEFYGANVVMSDPWQTAGAIRS